MKIAVMAETQPGEHRVALVPATVRLYEKLDMTVAVQSGAGEQASFTDDEYREAGATVVGSLSELLSGADVVLKVQPPSEDEVASLPSGTTLVSHLNPLGDPAGMSRLARKGVTAFSVEMIPRITRAQKMDVLSSQATVAGYKAVLIAAGHLPKFLPMLTTAAGTIRPGKGLILGAGVAGLQAIATARRLGAVVSAFDVRPAVKEQVESLGATFLEAQLDEGAEDEGGYAKELSADQHAAELELIGGALPDMDFVITTAQIPGRAAPVLITRDMVATMKPGSVIVDLAASTGGNCELTRAGETVVESGVRILGPENLPGELPFHASQMYARNLVDFVGHVFGGEEGVDWEDEITAATCVTREGDIVNDRVKEQASAASGGES